MKNANAADQRVAPFDQLEHVRGICAVDIRVTPVFDRSAIAGFGEGEDLEPQFGIARKAAARVHGDLMMSLQCEPAQLRINLRDERALMSCVASVECDDARRIAAFPRSLPCFNTRARGGHGDNLTRRGGKGKWYARKEFIPSVVVLGLLRYQG